MKCNYFDKRIRNSMTARQLLAREIEGWGPMRDDTLIRDRAAIFRKLLSSAAGIAGTFNMRIALP